jgi:hypothetical protein
LIGGGFLLAGQLGLEFRSLFVCSMRLVGAAEFGKEDGAAALRLGQVGLELGRFVGFSQGLVEPP